MVTKSEVKYIQSLGQKKFRDEAGVFVAEGPKIAGELLEAPGVVPLQVYATAEWSGAQQPVTGRLPAGVLKTIRESELERISFLSTPNQVLVVFRKPAQRPVTSAGTVSLMLDGIQDPGNMGTIIRIADWFGVQQLICSADTADAYAPKVVQSTMGSIARVNILYADLVDFASANPGVEIYAATLGGKPLQQAGRINEGIVLIGNESRGISPALLAKASRQITIPKKGAAESLNAAVATGILLSHLLA